MMIKHRFDEGSFVFKVNENTEERAFEVDFLNCVVDKEDNFRVIDSDSHFSSFFGVHPSKIHQGKLFLQEIIIPPERQEVLSKICKKDSPYIYMDFDVIKKDGRRDFVHCTAQNYENSSLCRLVFADVSRSREKTEKLREQAREVNHLIDLVSGGVCLFKVTPNMHFEALYLNEACCRLFATDKDSFNSKAYRIDELIHPEDKTLVFQAVGRAMATGEEIDLEYRVMPHKNSYIWCKCNAAVHKKDEDGSPIFHAVFTDITRIKDAEKKADEANDKLVNLLKNLNGAIFFTTPEKPFICDLISGDFVRLIQYSRSDFFEKLSGDLSRLIPQPSEPLEDDIRKQISKGGKSEITYKISAKGSKTVCVKDSRKLITQEDGSSALICELFVCE